MDFPVHAKLLISYGANLEAIDSVLDRTMLLSAVYWRSHNVLPILLANGARTDVLDARKASLLHYAANFGDLGTLEILRDFNIGALDVDALDDAGRTARTIFESRTDRCIEEDDVIRVRSAEAFRTILDRAKGVHAESSPVCSSTRPLDSSGGDEALNPSQNHSNAPLSPMVTETWSLER
ncbi:hypothetical protein G7Y79_00061g092850 [Physcia stellaris]|nr:hypothetical protein G7Y79_00061g092850 [Physcia stellaris]